MSWQRFDVLTLVISTISLVVAPVVTEVNWGASLYSNIRGFPEMVSLTTRISCGIAPLTPSRDAKFIAQAPGWSLVLTMMYPPKTAAVSLSLSNHWSIKGYHGQRHFGILRDLDPSPPTDKNFTWWSWDTPLMGRSLGDSEPWSNDAKPPGLLSAVLLLSNHISSTTETEWCHSRLLSQDKKSKLLCHDHHNLTTNYLVTIVNWFPIIFVNHHQPSTTISSHSPVLTAIVHSAVFTTIWDIHDYQSSSTIINTINHD